MAQLRAFFGADLRPCEQGFILEVILDLHKQKVFFYCFGIFYFFQAGKLNICGIKNVNKPKLEVLTANN